MTQVLINIREENVSLVKVLVEKLSGDFEIKKEEKAAKKKVNGKIKTETKKVPVDFFLENGLIWILILKHGEKKYGKENNTF